jgi:lactose/L-arabinose transport system permease protein
LIEPIFLPAPNGRTVFHHVKVWRAVAVFKPWIKDFKINRHFYFFVFPYLILILFFLVAPLIFSVYISLFNWSGIKAASFVGLKNFHTALTSPLFWKSVTNTVVIGLIYFPVLLLSAILFAVILNQQWLRWKKGFRAMIFLPAVTSLVVVSMVFFMIFEQNSGLLNLLLGLFGVDAIPWLKSADWSKISISILLVWRWTGYNTVIMLAGLQSIPIQLYEAARIDGAGGIQTFLKITLPMMKNIILFAIVMGTFGTFNIFAEPYILTKGGPSNSTLTTGLFIYREAFQNFRLGNAAAVSLIVFLFTIILSVIQFRMLSEKKG